MASGKPFSTSLKRKIMGAVSVGLPAKVIARLAGVSRWTAYDAGRPRKRDQSEPQLAPDTSIEQMLRDWFAECKND